MEPEARSTPTDAIERPSLSELLQCPAEANALLNDSTTCLSFDTGEVVFAQGGKSEGLYVVISGQFARKAQRLQSRVMLTPARPGDLVELAAALGDGCHTYTMTAQDPGSLLLIRIDALRAAFQSYPPLRMQLLEELAREVSRAYRACCQSRTVRTRRRNVQAATA
jgi:CRP-like cAMP-binding protein